MTTALVVALVCVVAARPRFIAIPIEDVEFVEVSSPYRQHDYHRPLVRVVRRAVHPYQQTPAERYEEPTPADTNRFERGAYGGDGGGGHDYVDYGAYTGGHGAFGWYTDHPVGH